MWTIHEHLETGKFCLMSLVGLPVPNDAQDDVRWFDSYEEADDYTEVLAADINDLVKSLEK